METIGRIRIIKSIKIGGHFIDKNTKYSDNYSEYYKIAYHLFKRNLFPSCLFIILKSKFQNIDIEINVSNHISLRELKEKHSYLFDYKTETVEFKEYEKDIKELFCLK